MVTVNRKKPSSKKVKRNASKSRSQAPPPRAKSRAPAKKRARSTAAPAPALTAAATVEVGEQDALRAKFELAPPRWTRVLDERERAQTIPWGYGRDKVVAMPIDPERLYVYWEVTDEAIARARAELGRSGDDAWLDLRVYDVTGILFDGGNAHHFSDVGIARSDRQWFLTIGRPTSTVVVELGLLARDGSFAKIARSHRADFPRREPKPRPPLGHVEWMTVRAVPADGGRTQLAIESAPQRHDHGGGNGAGRDGGNGAATPAQHREWSEWDSTRGESWLAGAPWFTAIPGEIEEIRFGPDEQRAFREWFGLGFWSQQWELGASGWEWIGPTIEEHWESGPFPIEVGGESVPLETSRFDEGVTVQRLGGLSARAARPVARRDPRHRSARRRPRARALGGAPLVDHRERPRARRDPRVGRPHRRGRACTRRVGAARRERAIARRRERAPLAVRLGAAPRRRVRAALARRERAPPRRSEGARLRRRERAASARRQ